MTGVGAIANSARYSAAIWAQSLASARAARAWTAAIAACSA